MKQFLQGFRCGGSGVFLHAHGSCSVLCTMLSRLTCLTGCGSTWAYVQAQHQRHNSCTTTASSLLMMYIPPAVLCEAPLPPPGACNLQLWPPTPHTSTSPKGCKGCGYQPYTRAHISATRQSAYQPHLHTTSAQLSPTPCHPLLPPREQAPGIRVFFPDDQELAVARSGQTADPAAGRAAFDAKFDDSSRFKLGYLTKQNAAWAVLGVNLFGAGFKPSQLVQDSDALFLVAYPSFNPRWGAGAAAGVVVLLGCTRGWPCAQAPAGSGQDGGLHWVWWQRSSASSAAMKAPAPLAFSGKARAPTRCPHLSPCHVDTRTLDLRAALHLATPRQQRSTSVQQQAWQHVHPHMPRPCLAAGRSSQPARSCGRSAPGSRAARSSSSTASWTASVTATTRRCSSQRWHGWRGSSCRCLTTPTTYATSRVGWQRGCGSAVCCVPGCGLCTLAFGPCMPSQQPLQQWHVCPAAPHTGAPHTGAPHTGAPHTGAPLTGAPHTGAPHTGAPHTGAPHTGAPHTGAPHTGAPHTGQGSS